MDPYIEDHLAWRVLTESDAGELAALRAQLEQFDDPVLSSVDALVGRFGPAPTVGDAVGGWDAYGNLMAYGRNLVQVDDAVRIHLVGGVHPAHRYKGIGRAVLGWQIACATRWRDEHQPDRPLWVGCYVDHRQAPLRDLLVAMDFVDERFVYDMHRELRHAPPRRDVAGVEFTPFSADVSEELRLLHNRCFADLYGGRAIGRDDWEAQFEEPGFRPGWSFVALADGVPVGYALSRLDDVPTPDQRPCGWTDRVGVDPAFRGRGISLALLSRTLGRMAADGCGAAGIGVDTLDPASPEVLAQQLGYEARDGLVLMSRVVPPVR